MPRFSVEDEGQPGLRIAGLYAQFLERERDKHGGPAAVDPRWALRHPGEEAPAVYRRPDSLLHALEAGKPVLAQRASVRLAYWYLTGVKGDPFPWDRSVRTVQVSPADVVTPFDREIPWYGCAVDEFVDGSADGGERR